MRKEHYSYRWEGIEGLHSETVTTRKGVLYVIACAASSATLVPSLVVQAQAAAWKVCVITTPRAQSFSIFPWWSNSPAIQ